MMMYALLYRLGFTPWERYGAATAASFGALLDREEAGRWILAVALARGPASSQSGAGSGVWPRGGASPPLPVLVRRC